MFTTKFTANRLYLLHENEIICIINDITNPRCNPTLIITKSLDLGLLETLYQTIQEIKTQYNL